MSNWKSSFRLLFTAITAAILTSGVWFWLERDDIESFANKNEWGLLQAIEIQNRGKPLSGKGFRTWQGHGLVCLPASDGGRVWIMMDATGSTRYKQMPGDANFTITKEQLEEITTQGRPNSTVERALASHLEAK